MSIFGYFKTTQIPNEIPGWVEWFAWRPVLTEHGTWCWLKKVRGFKGTHIADSKKVIIDYFYTKEEFLIDKLAGKMEKNPLLEFDNYYYGR